MNKKSENLKKLQRTKIVTDFIKKNNGSWEHKEWLEFCEKIKENGFMPIDFDQVGLLLENQKNAYLTNVTCLNPIEANQMIKPKKTQSKEDKSSLETFCTATVDQVSCLGISYKQENLSKTINKTTSDETNYLLSIPGMEEKLLRGSKTNISECIEYIEDDITCRGKSFLQRMLRKTLKK
ncbi:MAG TPA: hypothetical protein DD381_04710 [Lentisphaeria bacterium]|nr:MAG: hypothetical protein A2X47_01620 [Lentisphaerae bacterium GWF2_38_69]HBM15632.1 hypothetical protein [Lentisphaeria bacterium]